MTPTEDAGDDHIEELSEEFLAELHADDHEGMDPEEPLDFDAAEEPDEFVPQGDAVYAALLGRLGEASPQPRLEATRRVVELLGDPHRAYPIIHVTGTNGKTSTSRMIESILRAYGLRTGLFTSPHLERVNERITIDGVPISNEKLASNWDDISPFITMVDQELIAAGELPITFFEALSILAFAAFADAPVDVAVIEVGMGGEWDSTNVADGHVAVLAPISLDHTNRLGSTLTEIAKTKAGIIKPSSIVVSAVQSADAAVEIARAAELSEAALYLEDRDFAVTAKPVAVGGQLVSFRGIAGNYPEIFLPLYGNHQAHNASLAIAAVEAFLGSAKTALVDSIVTEGLATASSPGRLQLLGTEPSVLADAAHNPGGAAALAKALGDFFTFEKIVAVLGVLGDKDAEGIIRELAPVVNEFVITQAPSDRATDVDVLASIAVGIVGPERVIVEPELDDAFRVAREIADDASNGAVIVTGSITLVGEAITRSAAEKWKQ